MTPEVKSIFVGILLVLSSALISGVGLAVWIMSPFAFPLSQSIGATLILAGLVFWGWACFARKELYE